MGVYESRQVTVVLEKGFGRVSGTLGTGAGGFLVMFEWFENFRLRHELVAGREAAKAFWKTEVTREGREREKWQSEQWEADHLKRV